MWGGIWAELESCRWGCCAHWTHGSLSLPSNSSAESLDRLYPAVGSSKPPRKRTTSQCKSEPPLLRTSKRTIYTAGRPPWYNEHGTQSKEAFVIGRLGWLRPTAGLLVLLGEAGRVPASTALPQPQNCRVTES